MADTQGNNKLNYLSGINILNALDFQKVSTAYQDGTGRDVCDSCGSYYVVCPGELSEIKIVVKDMYEALTEILKGYDPEEKWNTTINKGLQAIAKAEGKE